MRKNIILMLLMIFLMNATTSFTYAASAANVGKSAKIITVAKTGGDYKTISKALSSITDASSSNRYAIKVMPGIYEESIQMKPYVDMVGSGQENTKITSSNSYTVMGADNSSIENIWIDSTEAAKSEYEPSAIINDGTSMTINNVKVTINNPRMPMTQAFGIQTIGPASKPIISNCTVHATGTDQRGLIGIGGVGPKADGSSPTITNCIITIDTSGAAYSFWNVGIRTREGGATVKKSTIKVVGAEYNQGIEGAKDIRDSKIEVIGTSNTVSNIGIEYARVTGSEVIIGGTAKETNCAVSRGNQIDSSLIDGPVCDKGSKIVKCWDKKKKPIPNQ